MINIVLVEPEIPQNTGNIARTCAATGCKLHLVKPMGFTVTDAALKRAGLDYWKNVDITYYDSFQEFLDININENIYLCTTKGVHDYCEIVYEDNCFILFGKETKGLPEGLIEQNLDKSIRIPMKDCARSLNLSNSVAIVAYEALRQNNFKGLVHYGKYKNS